LFLRNWSASLLACVLSLACASGGSAPQPSNDAAPDVGGTGPGGVPVGTNPGGVKVSCDQSAAPGESPLMKLSTLQYRNTVKDLLSSVGAQSLLADVASLLASIPDDSLADGFRGRDNRTTLEHVQGYFNVGRAVGDAIAKDSKLLSAVAGSCASDTKLTGACVSGFTDRFVRLAYRRPLADAERADYAALNDGVRTPSEAIRAMVIVALSSPRFVNQVEVDGAASSAADLLQLTSYEIASRLSYTFWQTMPDAELFAAAADGSLATDAGFARQLERVFADPRTKESLWRFWNEWFKLEKFTGFETTRPALQALAEGESLGVAGHDHYRDMVQEVRDLTQLFTFGKTSTAAELLTTDISVTPSADLAHLYGVPPWSGQGDYPKLPAGTRGGLLQRAALLVSNLEQTNPFHRGALLRRSVLCDPLPQPDPNSLPPGSLDPPPPSDAQTTRQRFQAKVEGKALCQGCHGGFSDLGYVLEGFDALGRYRTKERVFDEKTGKLLAELPIDTEAVAKVEPDDLAPIEGPAALNQRLVDSEKVEACMAQRYFEFAARRAVSPGTLDSCVVQDLAAGLKDPAVGLGGAFRRLAQYSSFFQRKVGPQ
ncbi:MAG TPA: DUF1592 domain-containing protein, partial [Polyangiaceae bacterium]|nr:DUF1592 domain-containing protein [Polyangiaceae bacterium]